MPLARMLSRRGWTFAVVALVLAAAAAFAAWRLLRPVPLELASATRGSIPAQVAGPGTVQARVPVTISARLTSTIIDVSADVGDAVQAGQVLVTLDARDLSARRGAVLKQQESVARQVEAADAAVAKARADLDLARARQRRDADLHAQGFVSLASLDTSTAGARAAEAALENAEAARDARRADHGAVSHELQAAGAQLAYTRLTTPMAGVVVQRLAEPGTTVSPGTPILRLVDPRTLWVATRVDEALVARVMPGQPASIRLRSGAVLPGRVERIAMQSDAATRELDVHVAFAGTPPRVAIDQEADVRIEVGRDEGLVIPATALAQDGTGRNGVLQVVEGRARFVPVVTGAAGEGRVLVREGLKAGDLVVANAREAKAGMRVRPLAR
ncbi:MAG TPA: efflux RND transporter periplasmic adaptor subunit [Ramlibacter sp.]